MIVSKSRWSLIQAILLLPYLKQLRMLSKILSKTQAFTRLASKTSFSFASQRLMGLMTQRPRNFFSQSEKIGDEKLEQIKRQGQEFYETQLSDIIELKKIQDFNLIIKSTEVPLLVNFYANWNMACKTMTPKLEAKIKQSNGQIKLLHINIDNFGEIVNVFQVKAVPTIFLVYKGRALDSFTGDISDQMLGKFLETVNRATKFDKGEDDAVKRLEQAQIDLRNGNYENAEKLLLDLKTSNIKEEFGFVRNIFLAFVYAELGKITNLKSLVQIMVKNQDFYVSKSEFKDLYLNLLERCQQIEKAKEENSQMVNWKAKLQKEPNNLQLKFDASLFYQQNELYEEALNELLNIVKINKQWEDKKANKAILQIFKKLGNASPVTQSYRKLFQRALH